MNPQATTPADGLQMPPTSQRASALDAMRALLARDLRLALRRRADPLSVLVFFVLVASLFPLGVGPEPALLRTMAPGVVFVAALLAAMLSLGRLFADDFHDGTLEQLLLSACPLPLLVLAKILAHWICTGLLLALVSPLLVLPLCVPVLIFGTAAVDASRTGMSVEGHFSLLLAFLVLAVVGAPWATATALRIALE